MDILLSFCKPVIVLKTGVTKTNEKKCLMIRAPGYRGRCRPFAWQKGYHGDAGNSVQHLEGRPMPSCEEQRKTLAQVCRALTLCPRLSRRRACRPDPSSRKAVRGVQVVCLCLNAQARTQRGQINCLESRERKKILITLNFQPLYSHLRYQNSKVRNNQELF